MAAVPALRSESAALDQPRPLRAVGRPCLDAALQPDPPRRHRGGRDFLSGKGRRSGQPRRHRVLPRGRQPLPGPSRIWLDHGGRIHHRPARPGRGDERRHGDGGQVARGDLQQAGFRPLRLQRLCAVRRRLPDGGRGQRGGVARGTFEAIESLLDLRQQQRDHRRPHQHHLHRGRGETLRGVWLERGPCRGCQ